MYCKQCGVEIEVDSRFCRHCGAGQKREAVAAPSVAPGTGEAASPRTGLIVAVAGGLVLLFLIALAASGPRTPSVPATSAALDNIAVTDIAAAPLDNKAAEPAAPAPNWSYTSNEDKVRGGTTYYATTTSTNSIRQAPPYSDETTMDIMVRKSPAYGTDVLLTISSGQMMCPSYEGCNGTVRFDNGPAQHISFNGPADNSSDTVFVVGAASFIAKIKKAKRVVIEKTLYEAGNPQFEFDVSGLKWEH